MAIGGFNGSDPSPTLAQFQEHVADGEIHYFISGGADGGGRGGGGGGGRLDPPPWQQRHERRDRRLGAGHLHRHDRRRGHALRPQHGREHGRGLVSALAPEGRSAASPGHAVATVLDVVIPVYNEEADLAASVTRLLAHLRTLPWSFRITIADNASTDGTAVIARRLAHTHDDVEVVHLAEKGRGRALKRVWSSSTPTCSSTWTSTCRPTSTRCCPWWLR